MWISLHKRLPLALLFSSSPSRSRAVHVQMDKVEDGESNVGMHLGLQILSFSPGTCKVEHLWATALQNSPTTAGNPDSVLWSSLAKSGQTHAGKEATEICIQAWKKHPEKRQELWGRALSLGQCLLAVASDSDSLHSHQPEHPKIWADYSNKLIWGPKTPSGSGERWSRSTGNVMQ